MPGKKGNDGGEKEKGKKKQAGKASKPKDKKKGTVEPTPRKLSQRSGISLDKSESKRSVVAVSVASKTSDLNRSNSKEHSRDQIKLETPTLKFVGMDLEWNSQKLQDDEFITDAFSCCVMMAVEESEDLSEYADFLFHAVNTGIRKRFVALRGEDICDKVLQYMTSANLREPGVNDHESHLLRMDFWAEAIKFQLLKFKAAIEIENKNDNAHALEIGGARSKDYLKPLAPFATTQSGKQAEGVENSPFSSRSKGETKEKNDSSKASSPTSDVAKKGETISTSKIKKRGEIPVPYFTEINDIPKNGFQGYVILEGFYNPKLIGELKKIGVPVHGILLLTKNDLDKKNFCINDVHNNISGTFVPHNVLPDYLKIIQQRHAINQKSGKWNKVMQFWLDFAALINKAPPHSCLHDMALLNCPLPKRFPGLDTQNGRTVYASQIYEDAVQRIYEMHVLIDWFKEYSQVVKANHLPPIDPELPHLLYQTKMATIPAECVTVPNIMESVIEQVLTNDEAPSKIKRATKIEKKNSIMVPEKELNSHNKSIYALKSKIFVGEAVASTAAIPNAHGTPLFIKSGDYAQMRTVHLPEQIGSQLAHNKVAGDLRHVENILWADLPESSKPDPNEFLTKLHHFVNYLQPCNAKSVGQDDMFFILHLLMSAGVERYIQKLSKVKQSVEIKSPTSTPSLFFLLDKQAQMRHTILGAGDSFRMTAEDDTMDFVLPPSDDQKASETKLNELPVYWDASEDTEMEDIEEQEHGRSNSVKSNGKRRSTRESHSEERIKKAKKSLNSKGSLGFNVNEEYGEDLYEEFSNEYMGEQDNSFDYWERANNCKEYGHEEFNEDFVPIISDYAAFKTLFECLALLTNKNGYLDSFKWAKPYLDSKGFVNPRSELGMVGPLKYWNFLEEYAPDQMIQVLSEAMDNYLSVHRMYCPFYDTILFIFNNPIPNSLESDSTFETQLQSVPGFQHFLEYTINDEKVFQWITEFEILKSSTKADPFSVDILMKILPDSDWVIAPSIKEEMIRQGMTPKIKIMTPEEQAGKDEKVDNKKSIRKNSVNTKEKEKSEAFKRKKHSEQPPRPSVTDDKVKVSKVTRNKASKKDESDSNNNSKPQKKGSHHKKRKSSNSSKTSMVHRSDSIQNTIFENYDLGKRVLVTAVDDFYMFPMDGSIIQYEIAKIEPDFRMMQLTVSKDGHHSYFYPYYIPPDSDLTKVSYVMCPYFHMAHNNGTIFSFQDHRTKELSPYLRFCMNQEQKKHEVHFKKFSYSQIIFASDLVARRNRKNRSLRRVRGSDGEWSTVTTAEPEEEGNETEQELNEEENNEQNELGAGFVEESVRDEGKAAEVKAGGGNEQERNTKSKKSKKSKPKEKKKGKEKDVKEKKQSIVEKMMEEGVDNNKEERKLSVKKGSTDATAEPEGDWIYPDSENSDNEDEISAASDANIRRKSFYRYGWEKAEKIITPLAHSFKITLPSGLIIEISDAHNPLNREVKQWYAANSSAAPLMESSRYYTANGTVVKFMMNSTIQTINARSVTTTIRAISTETNREEKKVRYMFSSAKKAKVYDGEVLLATGEFWTIKKGRKHPNEPLFLFTGGGMPSREIFRRRQDGVVFLHRHDGAVICHYPDGTRFTTRMVVMKNPVKDFEDWVFVGLKQMVEHPNYATVLFNSLSGNVHLKLPYGDWVRIYGDGSIKVGTENNYTLDVNANQAVLNFPPCLIGNCSDNYIPNTTVVKLYHEGLLPPEDFTPKKEKSPVEVQLSNGSGESDVEQVEVETIITDSEAGVENQSDVTEENRKSKSTVASEDERHSVGSEEQERFQSPSDFTSTTMQAEDFEDSYTYAMNARAESVRLVQMGMDTKQASIEEFLKVTDLWTLCKCVDSWENKFSLDLFGGKTVNKSIRFQEEMCITKELKSSVKIRQKYENFLTDIVHAMSVSSGDVHINKEQNPSKIGECGKMPKTKIFVVKRDLSGYEFLKQSQVDSAIQKAKSRRESIVIKDSDNSDKSPKKLITVMEPVSAGDKPNGTYHSKYREPVFKSRLHTNEKKHSEGKHEDLRWFDQILSHAHVKRPTFVPDAKENYLKIRVVKQKDERIGSVVNAEHDGNPENEEIDEKEEYEESGENEEETENDEYEEMEEEFEKLETIEKVDNEPVKGKKKKKDKKQKNLEIQNSETREKTDTQRNSRSSSVPDADDTHSDHGNPSHRGSAESERNGVKKGKKVKRKSKVDKIDKEAPQADSTEPIKQDENIRPKKPDAFKLGSADFGDYPEDIEDVQGIYDVEPPVKSKMKSQEREEMCSRYKAVVVRNFIELPKIDEQMHRDIITASMHLHDHEKREAEMDTGKEESSKEIISLPEGIIFGMGNPLLDICAKVDADFLNEFHLKANDAILARDEHTNLFRRLIDEFNVEFNAGGSTQNTLRIAQRLLGTRNNLCTFMGAVGSDDFATTLRERAESYGLGVHYQVTDYPTGKCAVLITGTDRSLCSDLGAANHFTVSHLNNDNNWSYVQKALFFYISGFFLTVSPESVEKVAKFACENDRPFMMNLSAPFICRNYTDRLDAALPYVDILFGNESEAQAFATTHHFETNDIVSIAKKISELPKENEKYERVVVFTQGSGSVIVVSGANSVSRYPVDKIEQQNIVDTNGAGDAFVGGFLSQYVTGKNLETCVKCGIWAAKIVIQQSGCNLPKETEVPKIFATL